MLLGRPFEGRGNSASKQGGFAALDGQGAELMGESRGTLISGNEASQGGGVDFLTYAGQASVSNLYLTENRASSGIGSAVHVSLGAEGIELSDCTSQGHYSKARGVALYVSGGASIKVSNFRSLQDEVALQGVIYLEHSSTLDAEDLWISNATVHTRVELTSADSADSRMRRLLSTSSRRASRNGFRTGSS